MVLQGYKVIVIIFIVFIGCVSYKHTSYNVLKTDAIIEYTQIADKNLLEKNKKFSVLMFRMFIDGRPVDKMFFSNCIFQEIKESKGKQQAFEISKDNYTGDFEYGDLLFSILERPKQKNSQLIPYNSLYIIKNDSTIMTLKVNSNIIGQNFYIDSLAFKEGQYYLDVKNEKYSIVSLKEKLKKLETWKSSDGLLNKNCVETGQSFQEINKNSDKNLIQNIFDLKYYLITQDELTTKRIF